MIKLGEIKEGKGEGKFEFAILVFTVVMVPLTDFLTGVLSALIIYFVVKYAFKKAKEKKKLANNILWNKRNTS